ncbi:MAG: dienelactone hydrolase family protein [Burkholderiales bacterium]
MNDRASFKDPHLEALFPKVSFDRRGFIASSVAAGFAVSAGPLMAQQVIKTPADGLDVGDAQIPVAPGYLPVYFAAPKAPGKYPVVMVIPEIWGLHEYQKDMCRRLAKAGYYAISMDNYFRQGQLWKMTEVGEVVKLANTLSDAQSFADLDALVGWLGNQPKANTARLGLTGMCRGGRMVWMYTAHNPKIKAAVAWYGPFGPTPPVLTTTPIDISDKIRVPVLGLYAGKDAGISLDSVERMKAGLLAFGNDKHVHFHIYPGSPHAFHADYRNTYVKADAEDGWKRMLGWLKKYGV